MKNAQNANSLHANARSNGADVSALSLLATKHMVAFLYG